MEFSFDQYSRAISSASCNKPQEEQPQKGTKKHKKGNEKKLTYFFIKKYDQLLCLNHIFLRAFFVLFRGYFLLFVAFPSIIASA